MSSNFKDVLLDIKVKEGSLKLLNYELEANVEWLKKAMKFVHVEFQGETIEP